MGCSYEINEIRAWTSKCPLLCLLPHAKRLLQIVQFCTSILLTRVSCRLVIQNPETSILIGKSTNSSSSPMDETFQGMARFVLLEGTRLLSPTTSPNTLPPTSAYPEGLGIAHTYPPGMDLGAILRDCLHWPFALYECETTRNTCVHTTTANSLQSHTCCAAYKKTKRLRAPR